MKNIFKKIGRLLQKLSSEPNVGGLRVTNGSIQYVLRTGKKRKNASVERLGGTLEETLVKLHGQISAKKEEVVKVVVSLPADVVYTQSFKVPYVREEEMEESANLNLQMITPIEVKNAFMDWQNIRETENQRELLGAFVEKKNVEELKKALENANFYAATFEFPALGISRLMEKENEGESSPKLIIEISSDGMDFFIVKNGAMRFDYFILWKEMQSEEKDISREVFEERLGREVRRVLNFAEGKTGGSISSILYIAPGMEKRVEELIRQNFGGNVSLLMVKNEELDGSWYAAVGSALRGSGKSSGKREINLGTESLEKVLFEERLLRFVKLWRNIGIAVLAVFLVLDGAFASLVTTQARKLSEGISGLSTSAGKGGWQKDASEAGLEKLEKKAKEFNTLVGAVESTRAGDRNWYAFLANLKNLARNENITITRMEVDAKGSAVTLGAEGDSHGAVIEFKNKLAEEPSLENVDLPLGRIAVTESGRVSFSLSFKIRGDREDGQ